MVTARVVGATGRRCKAGAFLWVEVPRGPRGAGFVFRREGVLVSPIVGGEKTKAASDKATRREGCSWKPQPAEEDDDP